MLAERVHGLAPRLQGSPRALGLGSRESPTALVADERLEDVQHTVAQVHVLPGEAEHLPLTHPCGEGQDVQSVVAPAQLGRLPKELAHILAGPDLHVRVRKVLVIGVSFAGPCFSGGDPN